MSRRMLRSRCSKEGKSLCHVLYNATRGSYLFGMDGTNEFEGIFQSSVHRIFHSLSAEVYVVPVDRKNKALC